MLLLALLGVSLVLIFAGRSLAKVAAFLAVGVVGAVFGGSLVAQYLAPQWAIVGVLLGFAVGGVLGVALLPLGIGLAVGYAGYEIALGIPTGDTAALVVGVAFFLVGALLSNKILGVATALVGGLLLFDILVQYVGAGSTIATIVAGIITLAGLWVQLSPGRHPSQPTTTNVGGQPGARS